MSLFPSNYTPDQSGSQESDLEITWLNWKQLGDQYTAEKPLVVEGVKEFFKEKTSKFRVSSDPTSPFKVDYQLIIKTGEGTAVGMSSSSTMFKREVDESGVKEIGKGEPVALLYAGKTGKAKDGSSFHWYEFMTERERAEKPKQASNVTTEKIPF